MLTSSVEIVKARRMLRHKAMKAHQRKERTDGERNSGIEGGMGAGLVTRDMLDAARSRGLEMRFGERVRRNGAETLSVISDVCACVSGHVAHGHGEHWCGARGGAVGLSLLQRLEKSLKC